MTAHGFRPRFLFLSVLTCGFVACAPAAPAPSGGLGGSTSKDAVPGQPSRTLVAVVRVEPASVVPRPLREAGVALYLSRRMFNAHLAQLDDHDVPQKYLAESLPELNSDSWRVFPDGRMETTYRLKSGAVWHDGQAATAADYVFSWRVYTTPELGVSGAEPWGLMEEVVASDPQTLVIRWKRPYPHAGSLTARGREFHALPQHILGEAFQPDQLDAFPNHPYWTREYLGLGPYRLVRWEPGAFIEAAAFDQHVLGKPKIERIKVLFMPDANTALASILAGEVQLSADTSLRLEQSATLKAQWAPRNAGTIIEHPNQWRASNFQLRPEMATQPANLDPRVRRALAHAVDKNAINDALYAGLGIAADYIVSPSSYWGPAIERSVVKYPFDLLASERLMAEAGFTKGPEGLYAGREGRYGTEAQTDAAADNVAETSILAAGWRQAGFAVDESTLPAALAQDGQARASFIGLFTNNTNNGEAAVVGYTLAGIPRPESRWVGGNRGGWADREHDRLVTVFQTTVDPTERGRQLSRLAQIFTEEVPSISLFFRTQPWAFVSALRGPTLVPPDANMAWNIHEWEFQ